MYALGLGVERNYAKAREWYEKAAANGEAKAQYSLGYMYEYGLGVEQDYAKARDWYQKAADNGHANAKKRLEELQAR